MNCSVIGSIPSPLQAERQRPVSFGILLLMEKPFRKLVKQMQKASIGALAEKISKFAGRTGDIVLKTCFEPEWVEPISINYRGYDVWEIPPIWDSSLNGFKYTKGI